MTTAVEQSQEEELVRRAKTGESEAWTSLFDQHYASLYRYAYARLRSREEAEDVAAQVFLEAIKGIDGFTYRGRPILAWLYRIARNLIVEQVRRQVRGEHFAVLSRADNAYAAAPDEALDLLVLLDAISHLTSDQREVIILRFILALPAKDVAHLLSKNETAVYALQVRAINSLRRSLSPKSLPAVRRSVA